MPAADPPRHLTLELGLAQAREVLHAIDPALEPTGIARLHGGGTEVYEVTLAGAHAPLALKFYPDEPAWRPAKEAFVASLIGERAPIAIPRWLALDETRSVLPVRYAVMTRLPGVPVRGLIGVPEIGRLHQEMGEALRRLHVIRMDAYGDILADGVHEPRPTNAEHMALGFETAFARFRRHGGDPGLARALEGYLADRVQALDTPGPPVLCHDDVHPGNLLAQKDAAGTWRLSGLIDFGAARAGDPLMDLAKAIFCTGHEHPGAEAALREGYGPIDRPEAEEALEAYTLLHRLSMWSWLVQLGADVTAPGPSGLMRDLRAMAGR